MLHPFPPREEQSCCNCRFAVPDEAPRMQCCRHAPAPHPSSEGRLTAWPEVLPSYWCGEWQASDEAFLGG